MPVRLVFNADIPGKCTIQDPDGSPAVSVAVSGKEHGVILGCNACAADVNGHITRDVRTGVVHMDSCSDMANDTVDHIHIRVTGNLQGRGILSGGVRTAAATVDGPPGNRERTGGDIIRTVAEVPHMDIRGDHFRTGCRGGRYLDHACLRTILTAEACQCHIGKLERAAGHLNANPFPAIDRKSVAVQNQIRGNGQRFVQCHVAREPDHAAGIGCDLLHKIKFKIHILSAVHKRVVLCRLRIQVGLVVVRVVIGLLRNAGTAIRKGIVPNPVDFPVPQDQHATGGLTVRM